MSRTVGLIATQNGSLVDLHKWESKFKEDDSQKLLVDVFDGDEKVIEESDVLILFYDENDQRSVDLLERIRECKRKSTLLVCVVGNKENGKLQGNVEEEKENSIRPDREAGKGMLGRIKRRNLSRL